MSRNQAKSAGANRGKSPPPTASDSGSSVPSALSPAPPSVSLLRLLGLGLILLTAFIHARVGHTAFPFWDLDPTIAHAPVAPPKSLLLFDLLTASYDALGPSGAAFLDLLALLGVAILLLAEGLARAPVSRLAIALATLGSIPALFHALTGSIADTHLASAWLASIWSAVALWHLARHTHWRSLILGLAAAFFLILLFKGALQVAIEHPATVEDYKRNKDVILASRGWQPGSSAALAYERRLMQPEATGWFGLSNVFASFAAFTLLVGLAAAVLPSSRFRIPSILLACAGFTGLLLTGSKGGMGAALLGLAIFTAVFLLRRRASRAHSPADEPSRRFALSPSRLGSALALSAPALVLLAVVLRGVLGERLSELSLLFRWFYMQAAVRIFGSEPLFGVGPGSFQEAYLTHKNPLSPEEVTSPHSIAFDWLATLGILSLAWIALSLLALAKSGSTLLSSASNSLPTALSLTRPYVYFLGILALATPALATAFASGSSLTITIAGHLASGEEAGLLELGVGLTAEVLLAALWIAFALMLGPRLAASPFTPIAAIALFAHAQIEMTPIQPGSAPLFFVLLTASLAPPLPPSSSPEARLPALTRRFAFFLPLALALFTTYTLATLMDWERRLLAPAREAEPLGRFAADLAEAQNPALSTAARRERLERLSRDLTARFGVTSPPDPADLDAALTDLRIALNVLTAQELATAAERFHNAADPRTWTESVGRTLAAAAQAPPSPTLLALADDLSHRFTLAHPNHHAAWRLRGDVLHLRSQTDPSLAANTRAAWQHAADLDPYSPSPLERLLSLAEAQGDTARAADLARRILALDALQRLDPLRRLPEPRRRALERLAQGS